MYSVFDLEAALSTIPLSTYVYPCFSNTFTFSLEGPLPRDHYLSFFSVVKAAFEPLNDRKGELGKVRAVYNTFNVM